MPRKLKLLVAVHLALGIAPAANSLRPAGADWIPLSWVLASISLGQLMLLSFWAVMSSSSVTRRLIGSLVGLLYLATWPAAAYALSRNAGRLVPMFVVGFVVFAVMFFISGGVYLVIRRRFAELRQPDNPGAVSPARLQFSILSLVSVTFVAAIIAGLMRVGIGDVPADVSVWLSRAVMFVGCIVNLVAAPWAALAPGGPRSRIALTVLVAVIFGLAMSFTGLFRHASPESKLWLIATQSVAFAIPPLIVIVSLLVVRSCGFRLLDKSAMAEPPFPVSVA